MGQREVFTAFALVLAAVPAVAASAALIEMRTDVGQLVFNGPVQAHAAADQHSGNYTVWLTLPEEQSLELAGLTGASIGHPLEVWICGERRVVALVRERITDGYLVIDGLPRRIATELAGQLVRGECS
jgi:preprotein translocase subunit SecD